MSDRERSSHRVFRIHVECLYEAVSTQFRDKAIPTLLYHYYASNNKALVKPHIIPLATD